MAQVDPPKEAGGAILVVDDDESVLRYLAATLRHRGFQVIVASDGLEAQIAFEQHRGQIRLLLTDVQMPRLTGPQLADKLCALDPALRVVYMSGDEPSLGLLMNQSCFLRKPFTLAQLVSAVSA
jgi:two-component system cell cycle sensor histidine kinase/response regulator CckA